MASSTTRRRHPKRLTRDRVFWTVVALTVLSILLAVLLTVAGNGSESAGSTIEACTTGWKLGLGTILGMLGSRQG